MDDIVAVAIEAEFHSSSQATDSRSAAAAAGTESGDCDMAGMGQSGGAIGSAAGGGGGGTHGRNPFNADLRPEEKARLEELFIASRALVEPLDLEKSVRI